MVIYFSDKNKSFFPLSLKPDYERAGSWPDDAKEISFDDYLKYTEQPPEGKALGSKDGMPAWIDL